MSTPDDETRRAPGTIGVTAVMTAFSPDEKIIEACASVIEQVDAVIVVDDATPAPQPALLERCRELGAIVIEHDTNRGIGAALNTGIRRARAAGSGNPLASILTLDQDSALPPGYVAALQDAQRVAESAGVAVGMVGPGQASGLRNASGRADGEVVFSKEPIQSGLLIPAQTLDAIGLFDETLFIDGVDSEYFIRAQRAGRQAIIAPGAMLDHRLGQRHTVKVAGRSIPIVHAATFRYYYIARNRIALVKRYGRGSLGWAAGSILRDIRHLTIVTTLAPGRWQRLRATGAGLRDGVRSVTGRRPTS